MSVNVRGQPGQSKNNLTDLLLAFFFPLYCIWEPQLEHRGPSGSEEPNSPMPATVVHNLLHLF